MGFDLSNQNGFFWGQSNGNSILSWKVTGLKQEFSSPGVLTIFAFSRF